MYPRSRKQRMPEKRERQKMPRVRTKPKADESRPGPGDCGAAAMEIRSRLEHHYPAMKNRGRKTEKENLRKQRKKTENIHASKMASKICHKKENQKKNPKLFFFKLRAAPVNNEQNK